MATMLQLDQSPMLQLDPSPQPFVIVPGMGGNLMSQSGWVRPLMLGVVLVLGFMFVPFRKTPDARSTLMPHLYVAGSACTAAIMSMEVERLQIWSGMPVALLALVVTGVAGILHLGHSLLLEESVLPGSVGQGAYGVYSAWGWHMVHGLLAGNAPLLAFYAIPRIGLSQACSIMFTMPLWTAVFGAAFAGAPWGVSQLMMSALCIIGVTLITQPRFIFHADYTCSLDGVVTALSFAICNAFAITIANLKLRLQNSASISFFMMACGATCAGGLMVLGVLPSVSDNPAGTSESSLTLMSQSIMVGGLMALTNMLRITGLTQAANSSVANMLYLEIAVATVLDMVVVHGNVGALNLLGSVAIVCGCLVASSKPN